MRGTWYYDGSWLPLETEQSKIIEEVHLNLFQKQLSDQATSTYDTSHSYKSIHLNQILIFFLFFIYHNLIRNFFYFSITY